MFGALVRRMRCRSAARKYARDLPPRLLHDYGASPTYTPQQIRSSAVRAGLPIGYVAFGYAAFMSEPDFAGMNVRDVALTYQELRSMLAVHASGHATSGEFQPPPERMGAVQ